MPASRSPLNSTSHDGERVQLVEIGSHRRGAISLMVSACEAAVDRIANAHPGFYFGLFDIRAESVIAFQKAA